MRLADPEYTVTVCGDGMWYAETVRGDVHLFSGVSCSVAGEEDAPKDTVRPLPPEVLSTAIKIWKEA